MKAVLAAVGSRGDVLPFGPLAARLLREGHEVTLVTHRSLAHLVPPEVPVVPVDSDPGHLLSGPAAQALRRGSLPGLNRSREEFADFLAAAHDPAADVLPGADVLVASSMALAPVHAALSRGVPVVRGHLWPEATGHAGPMPLVPYSWLLPAPARWAARASLRRLERYFAGFDGGWHRGRLRLHPHHPVGLTTHTAGSLCAMSPSLLETGRRETAAPGDPQRRSRPEGTLRDGTLATGWWHAPTRHDATPPGTIGAPRTGATVAIGFGSMPQEHPERLLEDVAWAARRTGLRALVQIPGLPVMDDGRVGVVGEVEHDDLFSRADLAVHHGGSGTTGAAVRAGIPAAVVPHFGDQYWWGHRLHAAGVAPRPVPRALLTRERLARLMESGLSDGRTLAARSLGLRVRMEDGTGHAVRFLEDAVEHRASSGA